MTQFILLVIAGVFLVAGAVSAVMFVRSAPERVWERERARPGRPDYRLIWDLEEELGLEHLTMDRRPAPTWSDAPGQVIELRSDWYREYRASVAEGYKAAQSDWKNLALTPTDVDLVALDAEALSAERARAAMTKRREQSMVSSVDQSLRASGERGFL